MQPAHPTHRARIRPGSALGGSARDIVHLEAKKSLAAWQQGNGAQKRGVGVGHAAGWRIAAAALEVEWMSRDDVSRSIPPAYTRYIGQQFLTAHQQRREV